MKKILLTLLISLSISKGFANNGKYATVLSVSGIPTTICANESFYIDYSSSGFTALSGNEFIAQLSDVTGDFTNAVDIGSAAAVDATGIIEIKIPASTPMGLGYRIRVISTVNDSGVNVIGNDNGIDLDLNCTTRDYYWIGGAGNWTDLTHWEYTLDGTTFTPATEAPTQNDNVNFDGNSFPNGGTLTVDADAYCNDMYWDASVISSNTNIQAPQLYSTSNFIIFVYGNLDIAPGVFRDVYRFAFYSPTNHAYLNLGDNTRKANSNVNFNTYFEFYGNSSYNMKSDLEAGQVRLFSNATLYTNDFDFDLDYSLFLGSGTATFYAGSSTIYTKALANSGVLNAENSTFIFDIEDGSIQGTNVLNNVIIATTSFSIVSSNTFESLQLNEGLRMELTDGTTQTVNTTFNALGTRAKMIDILSATPGNQAMLELGSSAATVNYVILQDNAVNATTVPVNAFNSIDNGNNTNWNISAIASFDYYWIGGSGNWSDVNHWATTDGGTTLRTDPPGPKDNVFFTPSSFPSGGKVSLDIAADCNNMTWTDGSTNPSIASIGSNPLKIRGNLQFAAGVTRNIDKLIFDSNSSNEITLNDNQIYTSGTIVFDGSGSWALQDGLSTRFFYLLGGTVNTNNNQIDVAQNFNCNGGTINLGSSTVNLRNLYSTFPSGLVANTSTLKFTNNGYIDYSGYSFNSVEFNGNNSVYGNNTFENIIINPLANVTFANSYTQTFNQSLSVQASRSKMATITSNVPGSQAFLVTPNTSANIDVNYAIIQDLSIDNSIATNVITTNSADQGNNIGWDFATSPLVPVSYYWVNGQGNWSDASNHWSSIDGGTPDFVDPPGPFDDVSFTQFSSFNTNDTVFLDVPAYGNNFNWSDGSANPIIDDGINANTLNISGSLLLTNGVQKFVSTINFNSNATNNVIQMADSQGALPTLNFTGGGTWTALDSIAANVIYIQSGLFKSNGSPINASGLYLYDQIDFGTSEVYTGYYNGNAPSSLGNETIYLSNNGTIETFSGIFNNVVLLGDATFKRNNTINSLTASTPGSTIIFEGSKTLTVNSALTLTGSASKPIVLKTGVLNLSTYKFEIVNGIQSNISMPSGASVTVDFVNIYDNNATGGATFATTNTALYDNVSGWLGLLGQSITITTTDVPFSNGPLTLDGTTNSGLGLTYTLLSGDASLTGGILTPNAPGLVKFEATQPGDVTYAPISKQYYIYFTSTNLSNELGNMKEASYVIGQDNFYESETFFDVNKTPLARKAFVTPDGKFISSGSRRALIWNQVPGANDIPADIVIGQPDFVTTNITLDASTIYGSAYAIDMTQDGRLLIADNRGILIWNSIPTQNGQPANVIIGEDDFNSAEYGATANRFQSAPFFLITEDQKLVVSDLLGHRVLIFNQIPTTNGASADVVIGQPDFTTLEPGVGPDRLDRPGYPAITSDGKLIIPDAGNNRVLIYNSVPTTSGASADIVLGQPDMNSNTEGIGPTSFNYPYSVAISRTGKFAIADRSNDRVLVYNTVPTSSSAVPDYVLGQPDFDTNGDNTGGLSGRSIQDAYAVYWDKAENLYVGDILNNRFLVWGLPDFTPPAPFTTLLATGIGGNSAVDYWNSTNTALQVSVPLANDNTLIGGEIQIMADLGNGFENTGNPVAVDQASIGGIQLVDVPKADFESLNGFDEGVTVKITAKLSDIATNSTIGTESSSTLFVDRIPPAIDAASTTLNRTFTIGSANEKVGILESGSGIDSVILNVNLLSSDPFDTYTKIVLSKGTGSEFIANLQQLIDTNNEDVGFKYYIELLDKAKNPFSTKGNEATINFRFDSGIPFNTYGVGTKTSNYKIIAAPIKFDNGSVENVFSTIYGDSFDNTKMRIFSYPGGPAASYQEATGTTSLEPGKGYFALAAVGDNITSPAGETYFTPIQNSTGDVVQGVSIALVNGWNLIGNPFLHSVKWSDIVALSGITNEVDNLQTYANGSYTSATSIPAGTGAFVYCNNNSFTLNIPTRVSQGGRIAGKPRNTNPLYEDSWEVRFSLAENPGTSIGGIGMETDASDLKDSYDLLNPPAFEGTKLLDFNHPDFVVPSFKKDIRPTKASERWKFTFKGESNKDGTQTLLWDNSYFGDPTTGLYLVDKTHFKIIDMHTNSNYSFSHTGITEFEVYYGENALEQIMPESITTLSPYPNPFTDAVTFSIGLPQGENYSLTIILINALGKVVKTIEATQLNAGYHTLYWNGLDTNNSPLAPGIYGYKVNVRSKNLTTSKSGKLLKR